MAKDNNSINFLRSSKLKIASVSEQFQKWYEDLQYDRKRFLSLFLSWVDLGYRVDNEDGSVTYTTPEGVVALRASKINDINKESIAVEFANLILKGGVSASSCYSVFYESFESTGAKLTDKRRGFIDDINNLTVEEINEYLKKDTQISKVDVSLIKKLRLSLSSNEVWSVIKGDVTDTFRVLGIKVRELFGIKCLHPTDNGYCKILMEVIGRQLRSIKEIYDFHLNETESLKNKLKESIDGIEEIYGLVCDFGDSLKEKNSGLSRYVLFNAIKQVNSDKPSKIQVAIDEIKKPKFQKLLTCQLDTLSKAIRSYKIREKLNNRKIYPKYPNIKSDYLVPIGLTGLGKFNLLANGDKVSVSICNFGEFQCLRSHYFSMLDLEYQGNGYLIRFRNKVKTNKKTSYGPEIQGVVKEIGIQQRGGNFYLTLPYTITHSRSNFNYAVFFRSAEASEDLKKELPEEMIVVAVDLGINNPVCATRAVVGRKIQGSLLALDYGRGKIIGEPMVLSGIGPLCLDIIKVRDDILDLRGIIKDYKNCKNNGMEIDEESKDLLLKIDIDNKWDLKNLGFVRYLIQKWLKTIGLKVNSLNYCLRASGYSNLGDAIRLLEVNDYYASIKESYDRIHLGPNQYLHKTKKFDKRRANFRKYLSRRIADVVVKFSEGANVVFVEDLESNFDSDNNNNSLMRLFSAQTLLKFIEEGLQKKGIGMVLVDKSGTSRTDPVTGLAGYRDGGKLYVIRNKNIGWLHSDKSASLNILIRGLNHSVCPYRFSASKKEKDRGARMKRFLKEKYGTCVQFDADGNILSGRRKSTKGVLYYHAGKVVSKDEHLKMVEEVKQIKDVHEFIGQIPEFDLTHCDDSGYGSFVLK